MDRPAIIKDVNEHLDILGQQPLLQVYTQICFAFAVADASPHSAIIRTLTHGLERLSASFPWIAGKVVNEGSGEGNSGIFKFQPLERNPRLVVKDLRHDPSIPTMDALRRAKFPFSMLDETVIAPRKTLPGSSDESASDSTPVFLLQANFIVGGLLLTFVGQHNSMDMVGQGPDHSSFLKSLPRSTIHKRRIVIRQSRPTQHHSLPRRLLQTRRRARSSNCETRFISSHPQQHR